MPDTSERKHTEFQFWEMKNVLKMEGDDDSLKCQLYLKNIQSSKFYVISMLRAC